MIGYTRLRRPNSFRLRLVCLVSCLAGFAPVAAQEWSRFRGPNGQGVSAATTIPTQWSAADYNWKVRLPGLGHAQPVLWGEKVFVSSTLPDGSARVISCLSTTFGGVLWEYSFPSSEYETHKFNNMAASTPVVGEDALFVVFSHPKRVVAAALTHDGDLKWERPIGEYRGSHGYAASPILFEDLLIVPNQLRVRKDKSPVPDSSIVALERKTGKVRWKTPREPSLVSFSTPCLFRAADSEGAATLSPQLISLSKAQGIAALDPRTGKPLWQARVFDKRTCSSPVLAGGLIFGSCGSGGGGNYVVGVRPGGSGDVTDTHVAYEVRKAAPYVPTPVAIDGRLYLWSQNGGIVSCLEASSGKTLWQGRARGRYFGSPVWVGGNLYAISDAGEVVVVGTGDSFDVRGRHSLGEESHSTPAVAGGRMYLRTLNHVVSIGGVRSES